MSGRASRPACAAAGCAAWSRPMRWSLALTSAAWIWRCWRGIQADVSLRGTSREPYTLQAGTQMLGSIEPPWLQRECFPGALYLHNGRGFRVARLDSGAHVVRLEPAEADIRTDPLIELELSPRET